MTDNERALEQLRSQLADDPVQRAKLIAGLGGALAERDAEDTGERAEILEAAASPDEGSRGSLLTGLVATGALLYIAPKIASRVMLGQDGGSSPQEVIVTALVL